MTVFCLFCQVGGRGWECPPGTWYISGRCFYFTPKVDTRLGALNQCKAFNADYDLVNFRSFEEFWWVITQIRAGGDVPVFWMGLNDMEEENRFVWTDGVTTTFLNWHNTEPNGDTRENCVVGAWYDGAAEWVDVDCNYDQIIGLCASPYYDPVLRSANSTLDSGERSVPVNLPVKTPEVADSDVFRVAFTVHKDFAMGMVTALAVVIALAQQVLLWRRALERVAGKR
jgi:hypothetical protein